MPAPRFHPAHGDGGHALMRRSWKPWISAGAGLAGLLASACREGGRIEIAPLDQRPATRIVVLFDSLRRPIRSQQKFLLERLTQARSGTNLKLMDARGDKAMQQAQFEKALAQKHGFMLVFPIDSEASAPALKRALADGTKVIVFDESVPADARTTAIVCPEREVGRTAAEFVLRSLRRRGSGHAAPVVPGRIVQLSAEPVDSRVVTGFGAAFSEAIGGAGAEALLVHEAPCGPSGEAAPTRIAEALRLQKSFDVVFAQSDEVAHAAAKALASAPSGLRERMLVVGVGGALHLVGGGEIDATVYDPPLVDLAWVMILRWIDEPGFAPRPVYKRVPMAIDLERAVELLRTGHPMPTLE